MRQLKRLFYIILLNIIISGVTMLFILNYWEKRYGGTPPDKDLTPVVVVVTATSLEMPVTGAATTLSIAAPEALPQPSETVPQATPTTAPQVINYQVREGDTLGSIAMQFDVSLEALMFLNDITDPNTVFLGQILQIPTGEVESETAPEESSPTPTPTDTLPPPPTAALSPTPETSSSSLTDGEITVEILSVIAPGDLENERVRISRSGDGELLLANWSLTDEDGNTYIFPLLYLYKDGAVDVHTKRGLNTVVDLYWGLSSAVWESGEQVTLRDPQGEVRATYHIP